MKVQWTGLVEELHGHVDSKHYARHIPGNGTEAAECQKPELSKKTKKKKAAHPTCKSFGNYIAESKAILHDPERRAIWQAKYDETLYRARKWGKPAYGRLSRATLARLLGKCNYTARILIIGNFYAIPKISEK